jgi:Concanavalin A-like lectin/glucanases superfamily
MNSGGTPDTSADPLYIGAGYNSGPTSFFNGMVDDVRIYNRALSATEVKQLYKCGKVKRSTGPD